MSDKEIKIAVQLIETIKGVIDNGESTKAGKWQADSTYRDYDMLVLRNITLVLDIADIDLMCMSPDLPWAEEHFEERVSGEPTNPGRTYRDWPYAKFSEEDDPYKDGKIFSHTYQERYWPKTAGTGRVINDVNVGIRYELGDLSDVIDHLKHNPLTRQAYLPIFYPEDTGVLHGQRVPCTLGYYFFIYEGKLHCNYIIRSCDVLRHFRNDMYLTSRLLQYISKAIEIPVGSLTTYCFNLHLFRNDLFALKKKELAIWKTLPTTE